MKTDFTRFFVRIWLVLSEVPGWPDAPASLRLRRVAPIFIAVAVMAGLIGWKLGWRVPEQRAVRAAYAPVVAFEEEVAGLRLVCSDQQAVEMAEKAQTASAMLLASADDVPVILRQLRDQMRVHGWEAVFQAFDSASAPVGAVEEVEFVSARGRLVPAAGNPAYFGSLLGVFDQISAGNKRIDLTRLGIRADENGRLEVELNLRIACRRQDEEAS